MVHHLARHEDTENQTVAGSRIHLVEPGHVRADNAINAMADSIPGNLEFQNFQAFQLFQLFKQNVHTFYFFKIWYVVSKNSICF